MAQNPNPKTQNSLLEEFHYYPFGMCFEVSKSPTLGKSAKPKKGGLNDHGDIKDGEDLLNDCFYAFCNYDRWLQPEPLMQQ